MAERSFSKGGRQRNDSADRPIASSAANFWARRSRTVLFFAGLLAGTALASFPAAAQDKGTPPPADTTDGKTQGAYKPPAWLGRIQRSLTDTQAEEPSAPQQTDRDAASRDGDKQANLAQQDPPAAKPALTPIDRCDRLAGSSNDPYAVVDGLAIRDIDAAKAVPACETAVRKFPNEPRFAFQLGRAYFAARRYEDAAKWFTTAANAGQAVAMSNLGVLYRTGSGVPQSDEDALLWFFRAADAGIAQGMANLALFYREGRGVPKDDEKAVHWFRQAAQMGEPFAMRLLATHFSEGRGVPADDREAARWYRQAALSGDVAAMDRLTHLYARGTGLPQDEGEAVRWTKAAADGGSASAMFHLADRFLNGRGVPQDDDAAIRYYRGAADRKFPAAMLALGRLHLEGRGVEPDAAAAAAFIRQSAETGYADAIAEYAFLLDTGKGVPADPVAAADWVFEALRGASFVAASKLRSGEGSAALRQALRTRLAAEGVLENEADDLGKAIDTLMERAWRE